jgi:hypothetical protein
VKETTSITVRCMSIPAVLSFSHLEEHPNYSFSYRFHPA